MVVKLHHEVVVSLVRWLFREATTSFSLFHIIKKFMWPCMGPPVGLPNIFLVSSCKTSNEMYISLVAQKNSSEMQHFLGNSMQPEAQRDFARLGEYCSNIQYITPSLNSTVHIGDEPRHS
jgi:hypothetical protein